MKGGGSRSRRSSGRRSGGSRSRMGGRRRRESGSLSVPGLLVLTAVAAPVAVSGSGESAASAVWSDLKAKAPGKALVDGAYNLRANLPASAPVAIGAVVGAVGLRKAPRFLKATLPPKWRRRVFGG